MRHLPIAFNGPMALAGRYFRRPVQWEHGLQWNPAFIRMLTRLKNAQMNFSKRWLGRIYFIQGGTTGRGCPVASYKSDEDSTTGIQHLAETFYRVFVFVDDLLTREAPDELVPLTAAESESRSSHHSR